MEGVPMFSAYVEERSYVVVVWMPRVYNQWKNFTKCFVLLCLPCVCFVHVVLSILRDLHVH